MGRAYLAGAQRASCWRLEETRWVRCEVTDLGRGAGDGRGEEVELEAVGAAVAGGGEFSGGIAAEALTGGGEGAAGEEHGCGIGDGYFRIKMTLKKVVCSWTRRCRSEDQSLLVGLWV